MTNGPEEVVLVHSGKTNIKRNTHTVSEFLNQQMRVVSHYKPFQFNPAVHRLNKNVCTDKRRHRSTSERTQWARQGV